MLTTENLGEVLPRYFHLSRSEAKEVTAELKPDPAPPLRTVITAVPAAAPAVSMDGGFQETSLMPTQPSLMWCLHGPCSSRSASRSSRSAAELRRVHVTVSRSLVEKLATARDALSHSHPGASDDAILELGLDLIIQRHRKRRGIGAKPRKRKSKPEAGEPTAAAATPPPPPPSPTKRSRYVPPDVWRAVWERDQGCCSWRLENGGVCGSTYKLELDHTKGFALGAGTTAEETRLVCRPPEVSPELGGESRARSIC